MTKKFIPNGDLDFKMMAESFARNVGNDPARFCVSDDDASALTVAVEAYAAAFIAAKHGSKSAVATATKEQARLVAEKLIRRIANTIRANDAIDAIAKMTLGLRERSKKPKAAEMPREAPRLTFLRAIHEGSSEPEHELSFTTADFKAKIEGAARVELFCDVIDPEAEVPEFPGAGGSRPFYLRSYTRSPIRLYPPIANKPMRVIYWARWADAAGNVGPFSTTAAGWVEGGSHYTKRLYLGNAGLGAKVSPMMHVRVEERERLESDSVIVALLTAGRFAVEREIERERPLLADETIAAKQLEGPIEEAA